MKPRKTPVAGPEFIDALMAKHPPAIVKLMNSGKILPASKLPSPRPDAKKHS